MYRVAAYITAYEDSTAVTRCITSIQNQTYAIASIFIIDNSRQNIITTDKNQHIIVEHHPENIGIAGGLARGTEWAIEQEYDFIWTFDQDSEPATDALETLIAKYAQISATGEKIGIIAPLPVDVDSQQELHGALFQGFQRVLPGDYATAKEYYACDIVITSGSLVSLDAAKQVQLPPVELFIDAVDWLYCMNFRRQGYGVYVVKTAKMIHHLGVSHWVKSPLRQRDMLIYEYSPLRYYYMHRNHTFAETRLATGKKNKLKSSWRRLQTMRESVVNALLYDKTDKWIKIWACGRGTWDGFWGRLGKVW